MSPQARRRAGLLAAVVIAGVAALYFGREPWHRWQSRRLVAAATEFAKKGDFRAASLSVREAFLKNPQSVTACELAAQLADSEQSPAALIWRQRLVELEPANDTRRIELAVTATRLGETFIAEQALTEVRDTTRDTLPFLHAAAALSIALKQYAAAEKQFEKALRLDPQNESLQLNLATVRLALARPAEAERARAVLETLRANPPFHQAAVRALVSDARAGGDSAHALQLAAELRQDPQATLGDQLLYLEELQHADSVDFPAELARLQHAQPAPPEAIYALLTWMNAHGLAAQSVAWCETLPVKTRAQMPVPLAEAEARTALGDWKNLRDLVREADWGDLEFLRLAIHARVLLEMDGQRRRAEFHAMWDAATSATRGNANALVMLGRLVHGWGWQQEAADVWWLAARSGTGGRAALKALFQKFSAEKNTRELYRVARRILEIEPRNPIAKNNVASLALLLGEDEPEAHRLAAEDFRAAPRQPVIAATYAFSLHRQKRTAEAIAILRALPAAALSDPSIAACLGFVLAENGDATAARPFLETAEREKEKLFPEEAAFVARALAGKP